MFKSNLEFIDFNMLWVLIGGTSGLLIFYGYKKYLESRAVGKLVNNIKKISESAGFYELSKNEIHLMEDFLTGSLLFSDKDLLGFKTVSGFVKKTGEADIFLSLVRREFREDPEDKSVVSYNYYFFLFGRLDYSVADPLIIHHKDSSFANSMTGSRIQVENGNDSFNRTFIVRSLNFKLGKTVVLPEVQEILLRYQFDYPLKKNCTDRISCVFFSKKGMTIIAPVTPEQNELMSMFELGVELTETMKTIGMEESES